MKRTILLIVLAAFLITPPIVPGQTQGAQGQTYRIKQGPVEEVHLMTGMMTDIDRLLNRQNITVPQRQQIMKIMGEMGGVMQEMGGSTEIEGWKLRQQSSRLYEIKKRLDALKMEIEGK